MGTVTEALHGHVVVRAGRKDRQTFVGLDFNLESICQEGRVKHGRG